MRRLESAWYNVVAWEVKSRVANIKSAIKRAKLAAERTQRNKAIKSVVHTAVKRFETAVAGDGAAASESLRQAASEIDRAVTKGVVHRNTAARKKSRLARKLNAKASQ